MARARSGTSTTGTSTTRHDDRRARAVPALRAKLEAQHKHEGDFSCRASPRHDGRHGGPFVLCQPTAQRPAAEGRKRRSPVPEGGGKRSLPEQEPEPEEM
jgi:hypothetical protein